MLLQDFVDLGFNVSFVQLTDNYTRVIEEDERYIALLKACEEGSNEEVEKLRKELKIAIRSKTYQGWENKRKLVSIDAYENKISNRVIIEKDNIKLMLFVDKDTNIVDKVFDALWYFGSCSSHEDIWERVTSKENTSAKEILRIIYNKRENNAQKIRNYYNQEIKKIKEKYRNELANAKAGLDFLKNFK